MSTAFLPRPLDMQCWSHTFQGLFGKYFVLSLFPSLAFSSQSLSLLELETPYQSLTHVCLAMELTRV